jgi:hypothetical protein
MATLERNIDINRDLITTATRYGQPPAGSASLLSNKLDWFYGYIAMWAKELSPVYEARFQRVIMSEYFAIRTELDTMTRQQPYQAQQPQQQPNEQQTVTSPTVQRTSVSHRSSSSLFDSTPSPPRPPGPYVYTSSAVAAAVSHGSSLFNENSTPPQPWSSQASAIAAAAATVNSFTEPLSSYTTLMTTSPSKLPLVMPERPPSAQSDTFSMMPKSHEVMCLSDSFCNAMAEANRRAASTPDVVIDEV